MKEFFGSKNRTQRLIGIILIVIFLLSDVFFTYKYLKIHFTPRVTSIDTTVADALDEIRLTDESVLTQTMNVGVEGITGAELYFDIKDIDADDAVSVEIKDESESEVLYENTYLGENLEEKLSIDLDLVYGEVGGHDLTVTICSTGIDKKNEVYVRVVGGECYPGGVLKENQEDTSYDLYFVVNASSYSYKTLMVVFAVFSILLIGLCVYAFCMVQKNNYDLARDLFLPLSILVGIMFMFILPPFVVPDEEAHFVTAYAISDKMMGDYEEGSVYQPCRESDQYFVYSHLGNAYTYQYVLDDLFAKNNKLENDVYLKYGRVLPGSAVLHLPGAIGITVARLLKLSFSGLVYMGRLFSLIFACLCVYGAIKLIPFGKHMVFALSCLPICFQVRGSYNYDSTVTALMFLLSAYLLHLVYKKERLQIRDYVFLVLFAIFVTPLKLVYFVIIFLVILIPKTKFYNNATSYVVKIGIPVLSIVMTVVKNMQGIAGSVVDPDRGYTMAQILGDIPHSIYLMLGSVYHMSSFYSSTMVGISLGHWTYNIGNEFLIIFALLIMFSLVERHGDERKPLHKLLFAAIALASIGMSFGTMLMGWTPHDYDYIDGVQGRYFLPVLPLLLLCIGDFYISEQTEKKAQKVAVVGLYLANALVVFRLFEVGMMM